MEDGVRQGVGEFSLVVAAAGDGVADESGDDGGGDNVPDVSGEHHAQPGDEAEDGKRPELRHFRKVEHDYNAVDEGADDSADHNHDG